MATMARYVGHSTSREKRRAADRKHVKIASVDRVLKAAAKRALQ
jgi:hypothetical protein